MYIHFIRCWIQTCCLQTGAYVSPLEENSRTEARSVTAMLMSSCSRGFRDRPWPASRVIGESGKSVIAPNRSASLRRAGSPGWGIAATNCLARARNGCFPLLVQILDAQDRFYCPIHPPDEGSRQATEFTRRRLAELLSDVTDCGDLRRNHGRPRAKRPRSSAWLPFRRRSIAT